MHELSIAMGIVKIAEDACSKEKANRVDVIELEIGELAGIEKSSLDFAWPIATKDTSLQYSEREITWIDGKAECLDCGKSYDLHSLYDGCPNCGSYFKDIKSGKELRVKSLIVS